MAYGQTASGKTYTMQGIDPYDDKPRDSQVPLNAGKSKRAKTSKKNKQRETSNLQSNIVYDIDSQGIIPRIVSSIFSRIRFESDNKKYSVIVSIAEIYKECIKDLLDVTQQNLKIIKTEKYGIKI